MSPFAPGEPVSPLAPLGIVKSNLAAVVVPEFLTITLVPGSPVVTVPTVIVAAVPSLPAEPAGPAGP